MRHPALFKNEDYSFTYSEQEQVVYMNLYRAETYEGKSDVAFKCRVMRGIKSYKQAKAIPVESYENAFNKLLDLKIVKSKKGNMYLAKQDGNYVWLPREKEALNEPEKTF